MSWVLTTFLNYGSVAIDRQGSDYQGIECCGTIGSSLARKKSRKPWSEDYRLQVLAVQRRSDSSPYAAELRKGNTLPPLCVCSRKSAQSCIIRARGSK